MTCTRVRVPNAASLWEAISRGGPKIDGSLCASDVTVGLAELATASALVGRLDAIRDQSVLVRTSDQLAAALALVELDGLARRLVLCPPDLDARHLPYVIATAEIDAIVTDRADTLPGLDVRFIVPIERKP